MGGWEGLDVHRPGLFEGQRPSPIPAYGNAIGIGFWNNRRAEGPVSFRGFVAGNDGSGLQPLELSFAVPIPGAVSQAGMVRTFGAGDGEKGYPQMAQNTADRGATTFLSADRLAAG